MPRELGLFPYSHNNMIAPYTDGIISDEPNLGMGAPSDAKPESPRPKFRGADLGLYNGNTNCVDANTTWHAIFAGDF